MFLAKMVTYNSCCTRTGHNLSVLHYPTRKGKVTTLLRIRDSGTCYKSDPWRWMMRRPVSELYSYTLDWSKYNGIMAG